MLASLLLFATQPAEACGGFFCNNDPIDQAGEDIVFGVDSERGEITMHVQIAYTGSSEEFAWIVPVPANPELLLSTDRLFQELGWRTQPRFFLDVVEVDECNGGSYYPMLDGSYSYSAASSTPSTAPESTVEVVSQQQVGPYDTVVLTAQNADGLIDWLQANKYLLPDELAEVLEPYLEEERDTYFVALKMAKDRDVGELAPLALRYQGDMASIPIQLTAVAATEDMRLRAYVVGDHRAVPDSYYHVRVNDLVVDWFRGGTNWEDAITVAADEAGGHAFATDYSGPTSIMEDALWVEGRFDIARLAAASDAFAFFDELLSQGFRGDTTMMALFRRFLPLPEALAAKGVEERDFYNCLQCFAEHVKTIPFDAAAFAAAIDEQIVTPLHDAQALFGELPHVTRLTSSVSPIEMNVDPTFVFNADMQQTVDVERRATVEMHCGDGGEWDEAPRRLVLADGRAYNLPSVRWFRDQGKTEYEYLSDLYTHFALIIEDTSDEGEPLIISDWTEEERASMDAHNEASGVRILPVRACGCHHGGGRGGLARPARPARPGAAPAAGLVPWLLALVACDGPTLPPPHPCDSDVVEIDVAPPREAFGAMDDGTALWCGIPPQGGAPYSPVRARVQGPAALFDGMWLELMAEDADTGEELSYTGLHMRMTCANVGESAGYWVGSEVHVRYPGYAVEDLDGRSAWLTARVTSLDETVSIEDRWLVELLGE